MDIDTTVPHIGRIYDYVLGGHHNYEADRKAAEALLQVLPSYPMLARHNRWFLQWVGAHWAEKGHNAVLDLASGLPTQGHFHEYLPGARILFSDVDPVSVTYGKQVLEGRPRAAYIQADLRSPEALLTQAGAFFGAERKLAVGAIGILYLMSDADVARLLKAIHAFCAPGSALAFTFADVRSDSEADVAAFDAVVRTCQEKARIALHRRDAARMAELIKPWRLTEHRTAEAWLDLPEGEGALRVIGGLAEY